MHPPRHGETRQIRRAQARVTTADRKRRTRRLILIGSHIDSVTAPTGCMRRLRRESLSSWPLQR